jgi:hypothetical protein
VVRGPFHFGEMWALDRLFGSPISTTIRRLSNRVSPAARRSSACCTQWARRASQRSRAGVGLWVVSQRIQGPTRDSGAPADGSDRKTAGSGLEEGDPPRRGLAVQWKAVGSATRQDAARMISRRVD